MGEIRDAIKYGWGEGKKHPTERTTWSEHKATAPEVRGIDDVRPGDVEIRPASEAWAQQQQKADKLFGWAIGLTIVPFLLWIAAFVALFFVVYAILT